MLEPGASHLAGQRALEIALLALLFSPFIVTGCDPAPAPKSTTALPPSGKPIRNAWITPAEGFTLDEAVAEGVAWGTPAIQTPIPLSSGVRRVHFADANRGWATQRTIPTSLFAPMAFSADESMLASFGPDGEFDHSKPLPPERLGVLNLKEGVVVYARDLPGKGVIDLAWLSDGSLVINENVTRLTTKPAHFLLKRLRPGSKEEETSVDLPPGAILWRIVAAPRGPRVLAAESSSKDTPATLCVYDLETRERSALTLPPGALDSGSLTWWPEGDTVYAEVEGHPFRIGTKPGTRPEPVLAGIGALQEKRLQGSLSPTGRHLLASEPESQTLYLVDLKDRRALPICTCSPKRGPILSHPAWSLSGSIAGGWLGIAGSDPDSGRGVLTWIPFLLNIPGRKLALFRFGEYPRPLFIVEKPDIVDALRAGSQPWR